MWMSKHGGKDCWIQEVAQARYDAEEDEKAKVEDEKDHGNDLAPIPVVWQLVE